MLARSFTCTVSTGSWTSFHRTGAETPDVLRACQRLALLVPEQVRGNFAEIAALEHRGVAAEGAFAADMTDHLLQLVDRKPGLGRGAFSGVDVHRMEFGQRLHRHFDMLRRQAKLGREVGYVGIAKLAQEAVKNAHPALH